MQFIMDYPLDGKKLNHYLDFYVTNLKYGCNFLLLFVVVVVDVVDVVVVVVDVFCSVV